MFTTRPGRSGSRRRRRPTTAGCGGQGASVSIATGSCAPSGARHDGRRCARLASDRPPPDGDIIDHAARPARPLADSGRRLRAAAHRRSATGAVAAVHAGWRGMAARVPRAAVEALAGEFGSRSPRTAGRARTVRLALLLRSRARRARAFRARGSTSRCSAVVFERAGIVGGQSAMPSVRAQAAARITGSSTAGGRRAHSSTRRAFRDDAIFSRGPVHGQPSRCVLLVSARRHAGRSTWPAAIRCSAAPSIAALASRSACAFDDRADVFEGHAADLVCEQPRRACSGCRPAFLTL